MEAPTKRGLVGPQLPGSSRLDLGAQLRAFAATTNERINFVHRNVSIRLFTAIVFDTPVLTGLARGSWNASMETPVRTLSERLDKTGRIVEKEIEVKIKADTSKVAYLTSNLPYIIPLEYGWSKQQPEGMVRLNVMRFQRIVSEEIAAAKNRGAK